MRYKVKPTEFVYSDGGRVAAGLKPIHKLSKDPCDCVVRALAICFDEDYFTMRNALCMVRDDANKRFPQLRHLKWGYRRGWPLYIYGSMLDAHGYKQVNSNDVGIYNVTNLLDRWSDGSPMFPGVYFCRLKKHVTVVIDGVLYDTDLPDDNRMYRYWHRGTIGYDNKQSSQDA